MDFFNDMDLKYHALGSGSEQTASTADLYSRLWQTPNPMVINGILALQGKSDLLKKLRQNLIADHPVLRRGPAKPQVGTFEIYEGPWGDGGRLSDVWEGPWGNDVQMLFCVIVYSHELTNLRFVMEMLIGPPEDRHLMEAWAKAIIAAPGVELMNRPDKN